MARIARITFVFPESLGPHNAAYESGKFRSKESIVRKVRIDSEESFTLVAHLEGRRILWPHFPPVINPRRRDIRMPEPLLHLSDVGVMVERVGGGSRAECVHRP